MCVCVCVRECWEITFSVSAAWAFFLSRQIALLRELLLGRQLHLSLLFILCSLCLFLSHPTCLFSVILAPNTSWTMHPYTKHLRLEEQTWPLSHRSWAGSRLSSASHPRWLWSISQHQPRPWSLQEMRDGMYHLCIFQKTRTSEGEKWFYLTYSVVS